MALHVHSLEPVAIRFKDGTALCKALLHVVRLVVRGTESRHRDGDGCTEEAYRPGEARRLFRTAP